MHLKIAVCDDDEKQIEYLGSLVSAWSGGTFHTCGIHRFTSAEAFLFRYAEDKAWDILLLDIEMPGESGVELAKRIRQDNSTVQIIFITGFPDFIADGYEVAALHYLLKPVSAEKLRAVLDRAAGNLEKQEKRLCIAFDRQTDFVPLSRILYIEARKQYVRICTADSEYRMKAALSEMEGQLDEYFFRCQRSFLVNLRWVVRIKGDCVVLKNGAEVPISRGMAEKVGKEIIRLF
ncbi:MAG: response regulator transcription factor [Clostridia bacterium]|nr:response regulator transcription factor [Clostridia bacterium]